MHLRRFALLALSIGAACAAPPMPVVVTLTAPAPTPTVAPVNLVPKMAVGSSFLYADGTTLLAVPLGPFLMGHGTADNPEHQVTLSDFWIYANKVTNRQYSVCVAQGQCTAPDATDNPRYSDIASQNLPVVGVNYDQASAYCSYVNAQLPTEAQWEKAARGPDGSPYPWGGADPSCDLLNFNNCLKHSSDVLGYVKGKSPYGALNMAGDVYEWVADWFDPLYYKTGPPGDPPGPPSGDLRVIRSSGYRSTAIQALSYARSFASPGTHQRDLGFRCVVKDPAFFAPHCQQASTVAGADMASVLVDCPVISIDVKATACRYGGGAVVTFNNDHPQDPNASFGGIVGCALLSGRPGSFPLSYECKNASTALLSSSCTYSGIRNSACASHYGLNPATGICQWDGNRTPGVDCPVGEFYDPVRHCCLISSGKIADYPICPVGTLFTRTGPDQYACLPTESVQDVPPQVKSINPPVCPGLCNLSKELCGQRNLEFCSTNCSCLSVGLKCPTH